MMAMRRCAERNSRQFPAACACADDAAMRHGWAMLRCGSTRAGSHARARVHGHAGTSARKGGVGTGVKGHTCGGFAKFASYGPAGRTLSILDLLQQLPALLAAAHICEDTNREKHIRIYIRVAYGKTSIAYRPDIGPGQVPDAWRKIRLIFEEKLDML